MKKFISILAAAAMLSAAAVSVSAETTANGAAEANLFNYDFTDGFPTGQLTKAPSAGTENFDSGRLLLKNDGKSVAAIGKGGQNLYGDYVFSFDITMGSTSKDSVNIFISSNGAAYNANNNYVDKLTIGNGIQWNGTSLKYSDDSSTAYTAMGATYHVTIAMFNGKYTYSIIPAEGSEFNTKGKTVNGTADLRCTDYEKTTQFYIQNSTGSGVGVYIDNFAVNYTAGEFTADNITDNKLDNNTITITTNKLFDTQYKATLTDAETSQELETAWTNAAIAGYYTGSITVTIPDNLAAGEYKLTFNGEDGMPDSNSKYNKPSFTINIDEKGESTIEYSVSGAVSISGSADNVTVADNTITENGYVTKVYRTDVTPNGNTINKVNVTVVADGTTKTDSYTGTRITSEGAFSFYNVISKAGDAWFTAEPTITCTFE